MCGVFLGDMNSGYFHRSMFKCEEAVYMYLICISIHSHPSMLTPLANLNPGVATLFWAGKFHFFPSENDATAHFPLQAHFLAPESPPPLGSFRKRSSSPSGRPTTTSALQVRKERIRMPEPGPRGPIAVVKGVVGGQAACRFSSAFLCSRQERG